MAQTGDVISGRYVLLDLIGRGGMAEVFRARDDRLGREVAVKVLAAHLLQDPAAVRQLQREARAAAALRHPGLVAVFDTGSEGDTHYIVMELVEGPTLSDVLRSEGPLDPDRAVAVTIAVAEAVHAAHQQGIVHRDLKPSNVLFDAEGEVRVTDFGIAYAAAGTTTATATAMLAGSTPYLAPEQARGEDPTPAADIYALGCLLFETLTGQQPFTGPTAAAVIAAHLHQEPPGPSTLRPELPRELDTVVQRAMAKDPQHRQADALTLVEELRGTPGPLPPAVTERIADRATKTVVLPPPTRTPPTQAPPARPDRRDRVPGWMWALGGALVALVVAAAATGLFDPGADAEAPDAAPSPTATTTSAPTTPPASPQPSPTPTASPSPSPSPTAMTPTEAAAVIRERIDRARQEFAIADDDAEDLDDRLAEVMEKHRDDDPKEASKKLDELRREVDKLAREGDIDEDLRRDLQTGLDDLAATL